MMKRWVTGFFMLSAGCVLLTVAGCFCTRSMPPAPESQQTPGTVESENSGADNVEMPSPEPEIEDVTVE